MRTLRIQPFSFHVTRPAGARMAITWHVTSLALTFPITGILHLLTTVPLLLPLVTANLISMNLNLFGSYLTISISSLTNSLFVSYWSTLFFFLFDLSGFFVYWEFCPFMFYISCGYSQQVGFEFNSARNIFIALFLNIEV